jgi:hypothetical protein
MISSGVWVGANATSEMFSRAHILTVSELLALVTLCPVGELVVAINLAVVVGDGEFGESESF